MQLRLPRRALAASRDRAPGRAYWVKADGTGKSILLGCPEAIVFPSRKLGELSVGILASLTGSESRKQSGDEWRDWNVAIDNIRLFHVSPRQLPPRMGRIDAPI